MAKRLIRKIKYHYKKSDKDYEVNMYLDLSRFEKQFSRAQYRLDSQVMNSMIRYMPMVTHTFIRVTRAMSEAIAGSGKVYAAAPPFGRFLYEGKTMVSPSTGSTYAKRGERKVLVSQYTGRTRAKENLEYSKSAHPDAQSHWFEAAKESDGKKWVTNAKRTAGGGAR